MFMNREKEQRTKNKEQRTKSLQLKEQGAENVSVGYCHPQCFIYRRKQTLQKNENTKETYQLCSPLSKELYNKLV